MYKRFALGRVLCVTPVMLIVSEYDHEFEVEKAVRFTLDVHTKLHNIHSLDRLSVDDEVSVSYIDTGRKKIVLNVARKELVYSWGNVSNQERESLKV